MAIPENICLALCNLLASSLKLQNTLKTSPHQQAFLSRFSSGSSLQLLEYSLKNDSKNLYPAAGLLPVTEYHLSANPFSFFPSKKPLNLISRQPSLSVLPGKLSLAAFHSSHLVLLYFLSLVFLTQLLTMLFPSSLRKLPLFFPPYQNISNQL